MSETKCGGDAEKADRPLSGADGEAPEERAERLGWHDDGPREWYPPGVRRDGGSRWACGLYHSPLGSDETVFYDTHREALTAALDEWEALSVKERARVSGWERVGVTGWHSPACPDEGPCLSWCGPSLCDAYEKWIASLRKPAPAEPSPAIPVEVAPVTATHIYAGFAENAVRVFDEIHGQPDTCPNCSKVVPDGVFLCGPCETTHNAECARVNDVTAAHDRPTWAEVGALLWPLQRAMVFQVGLGARTDREGVEEFASYAAERAAKWLDDYHAALLGARPTADATEIALRDRVAALEAELAATRTRVSALDAETVAGLTRERDAARKSEAAMAADLAKTHAERAAAIALADELRLISVALARAFDRADSADRPGEPIRLTTRRDAA